MKPAFFQIRRHSGLPEKQVLFKSIFVRAGPPKARTMSENIAPIVLGRDPEHPVDS